MPNKSTIAFVSHRPLSYAQRVAEGVSHYVSQHHHLRLQLLGQIGFEPLWTPEEFKGQAVIGLFSNPKQAAPYLAKSILVINVSSSIDSITPQVCINNLRCGAMAAEAFMRQGFTNFLYVTTRDGDTIASTAAPGKTKMQNTLFNQKRLAGFRDVLQKAGHDCDVLTLGHGTLFSQKKWILGLGRIASHLRLCPRPLAVFCLNDVVGRLVLQACQQASIPVPNEVAVIGVDNDEMLCRSIEPNLSSVEQGEERVGYEAARLCDQLLQKIPAAEKTILLDPIELIERQSSSMLAVPDPVVAKALDYMKWHLQQPINIATVIQQLAVSRRDFEKRFLHHTGTTPAQELARMRVDKASKLLVGTDMPLKDIAVACGYKRIERFHEAFRRRTGFSPLAYRKRNRLTD